MCAAVLGVLVLLSASGCGHYNEQERRQVAHAARSCKLKLDHAREARDSMRILEGTPWRTSCAWFLAADIMPGGAR